MLMGIGDWGLGIGPNPQSPLTLFKFYNFLKYFLFIYNINFLNNLTNIKYKHLKKNNNYEIYY